MTTNKACVFYLVRHGETEWNQAGRVQGHTDIALNMMGKKQAEQRAEDFKNTIFHGAFSSDLTRAEETARILIADRQIELKTYPMLREQSWGVWEGHNFDVLREKFGHDFNDYTGTPEHRAPGVESHFSIANRVVPFLLITASMFVDKTVLVVTHGGVLKSLIYRLKLESYYKSSFDNLAFMRVRVEGQEIIFEEACGVSERKYGRRSQESESRS